MKKTIWVIVLISAWSGIIAFILLGFKQGLILKTDEVDFHETAEKCVEMGGTYHYSLYPKTFHNEYESCDINKDIINKIK